MSVFNIKKAKYYNKQLKILSIYVIVAISIWSIPFFLRISINDSKHNIPSSNISQTSSLSNILTDAFAAYSTGNKKELFYIILKNNLTVILINVFGGCLLGLGTFGNLAMNGFGAAHMFCVTNRNGMSWWKIIEYTAPHSIEMIGIWLSGGLGFYIASILIKMMTKNKYPNSLDLKIITMGIFVVMLIISVAAYVEAYISVV
ncbi:stage II sporulation protein M [Halosquirtibacter laminarini]|uniref:Stage II sporulation protein M n=1 Tax=Halosquirtibacter laminarini TaxID=3374600 RepID=A0AC61NHC3_9BACT|nr:stage II sporulation protein M [Prolixibacteraceae bacterium]